LRLSKRKRMPSYKRYEAVTTVPTTSLVVAKRNDNEQIINPTGVARTRNFSWI
jgi:hypothetical protein